MYVVLGATGHIGSTVVSELRETGEKIIAVTHTAAKAAAVSDNGVEGIAVDVVDTEELRAVLRRGRRAFLLNPPAPPTLDTNAEELRTARCIAAALEGSGLEKVVVASTYGARPGNGIGDMSVLFDFESRVASSGIPVAINRGAYYFTNFQAMLETARQGILSTPFPGDVVIPMVSPVDLGKAAAKRLLSPVDEIGVRYVEGPTRHTMMDVASILSDVLSLHVSLRQIPREMIEESFLSLGFSKSAAKAYAVMTRATIDDPDLPLDFIRGEVTLGQYLKLVL